MRWKPYTALVIAGLFAFVLQSPEAGGDAGTPEYGPAKNCKKCHFKQYKSWDKSSMAQSFENLRPGINAEVKVAAGLDADADYTHDADCLACHTTGYGEPGGFVSIEETPELAGIGCDSCHGPSSAYLEIMTTEYKAHPIKEMTDRGLIYPPTAVQCATCHNDQSPFKASVDPQYAFDFEERMRDETGTHGHKPLKADHPDLAELGTMFQ